MKKIIGLCMICPPIFLILLANLYDTYTKVGIIPMLAFAGIILWISIGLWLYSGDY